MSYTYSEALKAAQSARDKQAGKPVGNNTRLALAGTDDEGRPVVQLRLHGHAIVEYEPDGSIILDSCGYKTVTTKARINEYQNLCRVYSERGTWFMYPFGNSIRAFQTPYVANGHVQRNMSDYPSKLPFKDGVRIYPTPEGFGRVEGYGEDDERQKEHNIRKQVKQYVSEYIERLFSGQIEAPGAGDCWFCLMFDSNIEPGGKSTSADHLLGHMGLDPENPDEKYYVPILIVRAHKACGGSQAAGWIIGGIFAGNGVKKYEIDYGRRELGSYLRRYLLKSLGLSA